MLITKLFHYDMLSSSLTVSFYSPGPKFTILNFSYYIYVALVYRFVSFCQIRMRWNACITLEELTVGDVPCNSPQLSFFGGYFGGVLPSFKYFFNSFLLAFITGICLKFPALFCTFCGNRGVDFYYNSTD